MELIDRIRRAEKQAEGILRAGEEEAARILRGANSNAEVLAMLSKKPVRGADRAENERLAVLRAEWKKEAEARASAEKQGAQARFDAAVSYIVDGIRKGAL